MGVRKKLVVTRRKFLSVREEFHEQVTAQQQYIILEWNAVADDTNALDRFRGDSPETVMRRRIKCLFMLNMGAKVREKYGIAEDIRCVAWISPQSVRKSFGREKLPKYKFTVVFQGERYIIDRARYLEEMYGSYVGLQLELKSDKKGG